MNKVATVVQKGNPIYTPARAVAVLGFMLATLAVLYMYFLTASVVDVVLRKEAAEQTKYTRSEIAQLESAYIDAQHTISERVATLSEFTATSEKVFVDRTTPALVMADRLVQ
jgi:hypothetical protein